MLSERNSRAEHYDEDEIDKSDPWRLESLLPDEQVSFSKFWEDFLETLARFKISIRANP
jgi:hypothetical protein